MHVPRHWREIPRRYRMEASKCRGCEKVIFPGRLICPDCGSREFDTIRLSGKGKLETFTITRVAPEGYTDQVPYAVGIVALDEGVRVMGQITDCDPEALRIGERVSMEFRRVIEQGKTGIIQYGYKFVPDWGL